MTNHKILVTYASRSGSTAEIAEAIGRRLSQCGMLVEVLPMQDVKNLSGYRAVIAGSPIRNSKWLPEAMQFVETHRSVLSQKPFATFTVSITLAMSNTEQYRQAVAKWIQPVRAQVKPVSEGLFAGRLDFSKLPFNWNTLKLRAVVALGIFPKEDRRDWKAVSQWADGIHSLLLQ
ncbi:MAG TPA: flavodoxin domain-containing protein [Anaerolineales bacterium]|nr:flavodoxin domain-containing protein [Anaerolineales bacterium]